MFGGLIGAHRLYLRQFPEAFIFFSTCGVFLLGPIFSSLFFHQIQASGVLYDSFFLNSEIRRINYELEKEVSNEEPENSTEKYKNAKPMRLLSRIVGFSFTQFVLSTLYGTWLGLVAWTACCISLGLDTNGLISIAALSIAVTSGIYLIGNCEGQSRDLLYIWLTTCSSIFLLRRVLDYPLMKVLIPAAAMGTVIGNRTAKKRKRANRFTWKHYAFWSSLFAMLVCVIIAGATRNILDTKVTASHPGQASFTSTVGSLLWDRIHNQANVYQFFADNPNIEYRTMTKTKTEQSRTKLPLSLNPLSWWQFDLAGLVPDWVAHITVFVIDVLRAETFEYEKKLKAQPLQWAAWRYYLRIVFGTNARASDKLLLERCAKWKIERKKAKDQDNDKNYEMMSIEKACQTLQR
ncbi:hypothetical protein WR25_26985 isoform J [Diploscapter pachys]|nr:hypothetical protein WR25_26985 isoform J [Diploscapter pachys]